ncbi:MAG: transglutaminase domain-containing protein [Catenulispora sp.]|nr:transglutaminase domain-containing protein [Catenulispora sp.]
MTGRARIGIAAACALLLTSSGLLRLLAPGRWIWPIVLAVIVATASGELFRRLIRPRPLVVAAQTAVVFWYAMVLLAHDVAYGGVLPTWAVFGKLGDLYSAGAHDIRDTFVGGAATPGIAAILVLSLSALAVLVDALAATYGAAPLAGLPLLALYLVPATRSGGGYDWLAFALAAGGYTALLSAEGRDRLGRWGRPLVHAGSRRTGADGRPNQAARAKVDTGPIAATGHQITTLALVVAVLAPVLLPTVSGGLFGIGPNSGDGPGSGHKGKPGIFSQKLDLKANLSSTSDDEVLSYKASKALYLRFQTADIFDAKTPNQSFIPDPNPPMVPIGKENVIAAAVPGYTGTPQPKTIKVDVNVLGGVATEDHKGAPNALPLPYPAQSLGKPVDGFKVNGNSLALLGPGQVAKGSQYSATIYDVSPDVLPAQVLHNAKLATPQDVAQFALAKDLDINGVPQQVLDKAAELTKDVTNPIDAALKLQNYFQIKENGFKYNLDVPPDMNGAQAMQYLLDRKQGYCQLYAATMVAMARSIGIPARVALGFTPGSPSPKGDGSYTVRMHDYHSWPELFFDGVGWLRFEPTVGIDDIARSPGHGRVPQYNTVVPNSGATAPTTSASSSAEAPAGATQSNGCPVNVRRAGECNDNSGNTAAPKEKFSWLGWFGAVPRFLEYWLFGGSGYAIALRFILLVLLLVACVPMVLRIARRRARAKLASGRRGKGGAGSGAGSGSGPDSGSGSGSEDGEELNWQSADAPSGRRPESDPERLRILAAWAELRDSATDLGYSWPVSETPRQSAQRIVKQAHLARPAQDAMNRVTGLAERANYARTLRRPTSSGAVPMPNLMDDVKVIRAGLAEPVSRRTRLRATVLPPSALAALRERREDLTGRMYERIQGTGARLRSRVPGGRAGVRPSGGEGRTGREGGERSRGR